MPDDYESRDLQGAARREKDRNPGHDNRRSRLVAAGVICRECGCDLTEQEHYLCSVCYRRETADPSSD